MKQSKKVQQFAENLANAQLVKSGRLQPGVAGTIKGREAQARKEKKAKLEREKKERELMKLMEVVLNSKPLSVEFGKPHTSSTVPAFHGTADLSIALSTSGRANSFKPI